MALRLKAARRICRLPFTRNPEDKNYYTVSMQEHGHLAKQRVLKPSFGPQLYKLRGGCHKISDQHKQFRTQANHQTL